MRHQNQACTLSVLGVNLCETADVSARLGNTAAAAAAAPPAALVAHQDSNLEPKDYEASTWLPRPSMSGPVLS